MIPMLILEEIHPSNPYETRFGPNRAAADMEGGGEFHFWVINEDFWRIFGDDWRLFMEFWRNWFVVRELPSSGDYQRNLGFEASMASKQSRRRRKNIYVY